MDERQSAANLRLATEAQWSFHHPDGDDDHQARELAPCRSLGSARSRLRVQHLVLTRGDCIGSETYMLYVYRKTFWVMQAIILSVAVAVFAWARVVGLAAIFFATMQVASLLGGLWGSRLRRKVLSASQGCSVNPALP